VYNEPEGCHGLDPIQYTRQYDAIVREVRAQAAPNEKIQFVGLALGGRDEDWITYFLNDANHHPEALPLNWISFHYYTSCSSRVDPNAYTNFFVDADRFFDEAARILKIRDSLNRDVKVDIDECGVILPGDGDANPAPLPRIYWNAAAAFYAYVFANLSVQGYDVLGCSQLSGSPPLPQWDIKYTQFPSVSMTNWTTGQGNARLWGLKLLMDHFQPGDLFVKTYVLPSGAPGNLLLPHVQAVLSARTFKHKILFINKNNAPICVGFTATVNGTLSTVDLATGDGPARVEQFSDDTLNLDSYAVSVLDVAQ